MKISDEKIKCPICKNTTISHTIEARRNFFEWIFSIPGDTVKTGMRMCGQGGCPLFLQELWPDAFRSLNLMRRLADKWVMRG